MSRAGDERLIVPRYSLSYRLISILLLMGIFLIAILFSALYLNNSRSIENEFILSQNYTEQSLSTSVRLLQETLFIYDAAYEPALQAAMSEYLLSLNASGWDPGNMDLQDLQERIYQETGYRADLFVISDEGVITRSTDDSEMGLDFKQFPEFYQNLTSIRLGDVYASDSIIQSLGTGEFRKYGYQPTPDHRNILEISLDVDDLISRVNLSSFSTISNMYTGSVPGVKSVFIFGKLAVFRNDPKEGLQHPDHYKVSYTTLTDRLDHIKEAFASKNNIVAGDPGANEYRRYMYVPSPETTGPSLSELGHVIEITYDLQEIRDRQHSALLTYLFGGVCCIIMVMLVAFVITRYITHPIDQIVADIEIISDGAYDHPITHTHGFEFGRLETSIGKMVHHLKDDIISIRQKSDDLDHELGQRIAAEESLRTANRKLNLLSSITRHDILNQLSVITGAIELLPEEGCSSLYLIEIIQRSVANIHKQISFTRLYEQMGSHQPEWQRMDEMVMHAQEGISLHGIRIENTVGRLELYADPMASRAVFNLFENAVRHGGEVSLITLDFKVIDSEGIIVISDDGYGVPVGEKEKIFERGFGTNTGLGLFLVREIFLITEINIEENGVAGQGARFEIHVPEGAWRMAEDGASG
ncbi:ATP-binding protein [uncultured Methanospirillum sp.]|uniref:sensor histidine kinase n=1 Tax=uncultured Methanospirillum sp. TaxID=262503 RepID=UPI0029C80772|nr:ATP-binding protein [uncultured Methanospirillum sp.]